MNIGAAAEYRCNFYESDLSVYHKTSAVTNDFNHPSEDYVNFISTDVLVQIMSTQNDGQSGR